MSGQHGSPAETLRHDAVRLQEALQLSNREARAQAERLLMHALGIGRAQLAAHPEHAAAAATDPTYRAMLARRLTGEPIAYILGHREFYGLEFEVSPAVLIPRADTELLVDLALERLPADAQGWVADLGTGSGCVAIAIAQARPRLRVIACDVSPDALRVAARNAARHGARNVSFLQGDWLDALAGARLDMIVSNPPYIRAADEHLPGLRHEPQLALVSGEDGLQAWRAIAADASRCLVSGGWLLMEHGYDQDEACRALLQGCGFGDLFSARDLGGQPRVTGGRAGLRG
jgi:release factor glutamine methyltransferase